MTQRLITSAVSVALLFVFLYFYNSVLFNLPVIFLSVIGVYEALSALKLMKLWGLSVLCLMAAAVVPLIPLNLITSYGYLFCFIFAIIILCLSVCYFPRLMLKDAVFMLFASLGFPLALCCLIYFRETSPEHAFLLILLSLAGAFITDSGAYFAGVLLGKHKMAPDLSPKKTWEGAVGGLISTVIVFYALCFAYSSITGVSLNYIIILIYALVAVAMAIFGDLSASVLKRQVGIKDFGSLFPGQGGVLDRCDSLMLVAPAIFILARIALPVL